MIFCTHPKSRIRRIRLRIYSIIYWGLLYFGYIFFYIVTYVYCGESVYRHRRMEEDDLKNDRVLNDARHYHCSAMRSTHTHTNTLNHRHCINIRLRSTVCSIYCCFIIIILVPESRNKMVQKPQQSSRYAIRFYVLYIY